MKIGLDLYYSGFWDLDTCRSNGLDRGIISWFAIREYCEKQELDEEQTAKMHLIIPMMDKEFLDFLSSKKQTKRKSK